MALILRKVSRANWFPEAGQGIRPDDEVAADDFREPDHEVSVWEIADDHSNLTRIVAAIAGTRNYLTNVDYVLFDVQAATDLEITIAPAEGATHDDYANASWHRNLMNPSEAQILALVAAIRAAAAPNYAAVRVKDQAVLTLIAEAVNEGWMDRQALSPYIQGKLPAAQAPGDPA